MRNRIKLQETVTETVKLTYPDGTTDEVEREIKPALWADKCHGCGLVFHMEPYSGYRQFLAEVHGIFDECGVDEEGRGLGNMFSATVCSFACADRIMKGGWRDMPDYKPFADIDATLVRAECHVTSLVKDQQQLIRDWAAKPHHPRNVKLGRTGDLAFHNPSGTVFITGGDAGPQPREGEQKPEEAADGESP